VIDTGHLGTSREVARLAQGVLGKVATIRPRGSPADRVPGRGLDLASAPAEARPQRRWAQGVGTLERAGVTYTIFDGYTDRWAYARLKGWNTLERVPFSFEDAHSLEAMTPRVQDENYVKSRVKQRMAGSSQALVLIGERTKNLYRFVRWEIELAIDAMPIIAVNLNGVRHMDRERCPPILREACAIHIPFTMKIIAYALDNFPSAWRSLTGLQRAAGARYYENTVYHELGLNN
jgi:hypothetical protein